MLRSVQILLVCLLAALLAIQVHGQEEQPIYMERREASPFGDILTELKGKGLGGRMRFGKRSMHALFEPAYDARDLYNY